MNLAARRPGALQGITLLLPITMAVMGISVLTAVVPAMQEHFKAVPNSDYLVGLLLTVPAIWILLFSPVAGWLADRFGRRRILIVSMIVYAVLGIAPTQLDNIYLIILSRCGVGICEAIVMTVTTTLIGDYFQGREREKWMASQTTVASLSGLLIIWLGGHLGATLGWRGPFYLYAYSLVLMLGIVFFTWEPTAGTAASAADSPAQTKTNEGAVYQQIPWPRLIGICAITLLASVLFYTVITQNGNALAALGVKNPERIGTLTMLASLGVPLGTFLYRPAAKLRIGLLLFVDFMLLGGGFLLMGIAKSPGAYAWAAVLHQIGSGMVLPTLLVWATRGLAFQIRGRGTGVWNATFAFGQFISSAAVTFLGRELGGILPTFSALGAVSVGAATLALLFGLRRA